MKPIIVIPTYNEATNIKSLLCAIFDLKVKNLEVIIVDDGSPDGTAKIVEKIANDFPIHLLNRGEKLGLGSAYIAGFHKAKKLNATHIFEMDADFSHDPKDVPRLLAATSDADLVIGSRKVDGGKIEGWSKTRHWMSDGAMWFARNILHLTAQDVTAGFRCFRREVFEKVNIDAITSNGYAFQEELLFRTQQAGFRIAEIPVTFVDRQQGKSKLSKKDIIEFFVRMVVLRFTKNKM